MAQVADRIAAALARAAREYREAGRLTPGTRSALRELTGEPEVETPARSYRHDGLRQRDLDIGSLTGFTTATSTWGAAGAISQWLTRWAAGDPLDDLHPECLRLVSRVGVRLSQRQVYRILAGDRSG